MADDSPSVAQRIEQLERQVAEMRRRIDRLERALAQRSDHPVDRTAVREKVTFDWQA